MRFAASLTLPLVALRKESVDRNDKSKRLKTEKRKVALRKESVDRNLLPLILLTMFILSLSARRAWIEIIDYIIDYVNDAMSLSARRAWIEMSKL